MRLEGVPDEQSPGGRINDTLMRGLSVGIAAMRPLLGQIEHNQTADMDDAVADASLQP